MASSSTDRSDLADAKNYDMPDKKTKKAMFSSEIEMHTEQQYVSSFDSFNCPPQDGLKRKMTMQEQLLIGVQRAKPRSLGAFVVMIPLIISVAGIRYRLHEFNHEAADDHESTYSSYSAYSSYAGGDDGHGDDGHGAEGTVFTLVKSVDAIGTSYCFAGIIVATIILDFLIESLNELCEHFGHIYVQLARSLYQELMLLGIISFTIFLMNAEGFFDDKVLLFHDIEFAHITIFYLGLGLIIQGLVLAIINKEVKSTWKFSTEQMPDEIETAINETKEDFLGEFRIQYGACDAKTHLDIHLVRLTFLDIMNLPVNFAYNEYVNHCLDTTTLKMAKNMWVTWIALLGIILSVAHHDFFGMVIFGTDYSGFTTFILFGALIVLYNLILLMLVEYAQRNVIGKLGGTRDCEVELELLRSKWPEPEETTMAHIHQTLRDVEQKVIEDARIRHESKHNIMASVDKLPAFSSLRISSIRRGINSIGRRLKTTDQLASLGFNPEAFRKFQKIFMFFLRIGNMLQAFYIALIMSHWCWYAPSTWAAVLILAPLLFLYVMVTPLIVKRYAMIMSLGKPDARAMSETIEFMDNNDQALHQIAELIVANKDENETIDDVFQDWDANGDGELTAKELQDAMHDCNMHMQQERFKAMWRKIDIDSSGSISKDEFKRAIKSYVDQVIKEEKEAEELKEKHKDDIDELIRMSRSSLDMSEILQRNNDKEKEKEVNQVANHRYDKSENGTLITEVNVFTGNGSKL